jgi:hypothetical protein
MSTPTVEAVFELAQQLSEDEQEELVRRLAALQPPRQRPSTTLKVFHVESFPPEMSLRRADEYGDDDR